MKASSLVLLLPLAAYATGGKPASPPQTQGQSQAQSLEQSQAQTQQILQKDKRQAPSVSAPPVYASGSCTYGWSAGLSIPGGGISGGKAKTDTECDRRELARVLTPLQPQLALDLLCASPLLTGIATKEKCTYIPPTAESVVTFEDLEKLESRTKERLDRAVRTQSGK